MKKILLLMLVSFFISCGPSEKLQGFDAEKWKIDRNGCEGLRLSMKDIFREQQDEIKGLRENDLKELLGKPDKQELYVRSQKFFVYYLEPGPSCENAKDLPLTLTVRFNALGLTNEVFLENNNP